MHVRRLLNSIELTKYVYMRCIHTYIHTHTHQCLCVYVIIIIEEAMNSKDSEAPWEELGWWCWK